ncbi:MAG: alpha/beta fold hydrolase [Pseudobdellovibrionaceae bacterium]
MKKAVSFRSGHFRSFDGTPIYYEVRGQGEPIVFIYGLACLINHWHFQIEHFSQTHQVIAFDIRAHHRSGIPSDPQNMSLDAIGKDIPYLLRELGIRKAHFAGHSFGAPSMLKTYEHSPELFKSMVFINGFAKNPIRGMFGLDLVEPIFKFVKTNYEKNPGVFDLIWKKIVENPLSILGSGLVGGFNLNLTQLKDIEIYARGVAQMSLRVFMPYFEDMMAFNGEKIASQVRVPTLIISGDKDMVTPLQFQEDLHHLIKKSEFVRIPYGSHCTQLDFPDYINLKMDRFFAEIEKK